MNGDELFGNSAAECPEVGWFYYNDYCYFPSTTNGTVVYAWIYCASTLGGGARLASISDQQELDFMISISYVRVFFHSYVLMSQIHSVCSFIRA